VSVYRRCTKRGKFTSRGAPLRGTPWKVIACQVRAKDAAGVYCCTMAKCVKPLRY
jgi:hypothetical protein